MNSLTTEVGYISLNKFGEQLCGDRIEMIEYEDCMTLVLADGLGSGVKANILSTLTSKILATMMASGLELEDCVETIASTLPVCKERKVAYSTFTIIQINNNEEADLIQFDNPAVIFLRDGVSQDYAVSEQIIAGKKISKSRVKVRPGDMFVSMSDGVLYAGVGMSLNFGWQRENIVDYLEANYLPDMSANMAATLIAEECNRLYGERPGDDTTVAAVRIRRRQQVNLMLGPPLDPADDNKMMQLFFSKEGKKIVCGGTTSACVARYLGKEVTTSLDYTDPDVPPIGYIDGIDLVTEGVITITKVLKYAQLYISGNDLVAHWREGKDGASLIAQLLFETATDINFFVGRAVNPAHQNPNLPINMGIKMRLVDELVKCLEQMGKKIKVSYF